LKKVRGETPARAATSSTVKPSNPRSSARSSAASRRARSVWARRAARRSGRPASARLAGCSDDQRERVGLDGGAHAVGDRATEAALVRAVVREQRDAQRRLALDQGELAADVALVGRGHLEERGDGGVDRVDQALVGAVGDRLDHGFHDGARVREDRRLLRREVVEEGARRDAGAGRDLVDGEPVEAALLGEVERGGAQGLLGLGAACRPSVGDDT